MKILEFFSIDLLIMIILFVCLLLISLKFGKKLLVSLILSIYPTLLIFSNLSFEKIGLTEKAGQSILFFVFYGLLTFVLWKNFHVKKVNSKFRKISDYSLLSISYIILLISIYLNSIDFLMPFYNLSGLVTSWVSTIPYSLALILPIILILITNRRDL